MWWSVVGKALVRCSLEQLPASVDLDLEQTTKKGSQFNRDTRQPHLSPHRLRGQHSIIVANWLDELQLFE